MGTNTATLDVPAVEARDYCVKSVFVLKMMVLNGAAQPEFKPDFLAELVQVCSSESLPMLIGWISTYSGDKTKRIMMRLMLDGFLFLMH